MKSRQLVAFAAVALGIAWLYRQQLLDADLATLDDLSDPPPGPDADAAAAPPADDSSSVASRIVTAVTSPVRGLRNNNPGNIRKGSTAWRGLAPVQSDPAFLQFDSMAYGVRAIAVTVRTYARRYGLTTPAGIINRWAPPSENHTDAYVRTVADAVGVAADEQLDVYDPETMFRLVRAIIRTENGAAPALLVSDATVREGIALAG